MNKTKAILFDLDGVIYSGDHLIDGAMETMRWLSTESIKHVFVTNNTSKPYRAIVEKLNKLGISARPDQVWTPAKAAKKWLREKNLKGPVSLFLTKNAQKDFSEFEITHSENANLQALILGDMVDEWNIDQMNLALRLLMKSAHVQFLALGMTRYYLASDGLRLDTGPMVKALEYATGKSALVMGKPDAGYFLEAVRTLNSLPSECLMLGDDIYSDIGAAQAAGIKGVLVKTGKFRESDLNGNVIPFATLKSIADLPAWWAKNRSK